MISPNKISEFESYNNSKFPILSVYLGADSLQAPSDKLLLSQFHSLLHQNLTDDQRNIFESDITRINQFLDEYIPSARSLIIFSSGDNLWEVVELEFSMPTSLSVNTSPDIEPIHKALNNYSKYLVLLVDREKARMFTVEQGEISEQSNFIGDYVPPKKKMTGRDGAAGRSDMISRHTDELLDRHIDLAVKAADEFARSKDINFLILGGHKEMFARVASALPTDLQNKLAGSFVTEINIPINDILIESKKIAALV